MINISINNSENSQFNTGLLKPKDSLYTRFWKKSGLSPVVSRKLLQIAEDVIESLKLDIEEEDIIITGSIASYNWHDLSDIDLHIMLDFEKIGEDIDIVKKMLDNIRINWNKKHNILIDDKEVELYFQDYTEPHESNGIYSLKMDKWLAAPVKLNPELDLQTTEKKAEAIAKQIEHLFGLYRDGEYREAFEYAGKVKNKIAKMRKSGLADEGIYSPENLAFKMLRNSGYLEKLSALKIESYDRMMSVSLKPKKINENKAWKNYLLQEGE
jgi:predicted nucleotidyltransferase